MLVTPPPIVIFVRLVQSRNALSPMLVILLGTVTPVRLVQLRNALAPIVVTGLPSMIEGTTISPEASSSQAVMVTWPSVVVHFSKEAKVRPFHLWPISPKEVDPTT